MRKYLTIMLVSLLVVSCAFVEKDLTEKEIALTETSNGVFAVTLENPKGLEYETITLTVDTQDDFTLGPSCMGQFCEKAQTIVFPAFSETQSITLDADALRDTHVKTISFIFTSEYSCADDILGYMAFPEGVFSDCTSLESITFNSEEVSPDIFEYFTVL